MTFDRAVGVVVLACVVWLLVQVVVARVRGGLRGSASRVPVPVREVFGPVAAGRIPPRPAPRVPVPPIPRDEAGLREAGDLLFMEATRVCRAAVSEIPLGGENR